MKDMSPAQTYATLSALQLLSSGSEIVDVRDGTAAYAAMVVLLEMARKGLCTHERLDDSRGLFAITALGRRVLREETGRD